MQPGDQIHFWHEGRYRVGFLIREIQRGRRSGWYVARVAGKTIEVDPTKIRVPLQKGKGDEDATT